MLQCNVASTTCSNLLAWRKVLTFGWGSPCGWLCMLACAPTRQQLTCSPASSGKMRRGLVAVWLLELQSTWQWTYILSSWSHQPWFKFKQLHGLGQLWAKNSWRRTNGWNKDYGKTSGSSRLAKLCFNQTFRDSDMCWETKKAINRSRINMSPWDTSAARLPIPANFMCLGFKPVADLVSLFRCLMCKCTPVHMSISYATCVGGVGGWIVLESSWDPGKSNHCERRRWHPRVTGIPESICIRYTIYDTANIQPRFTQLFGWCFEAFLRNNKDSFQRFQSIPTIASSEYNSF